MKRSWIKDGFVYGLSATLSKFMGIFLAPIYTRFMSMAEYGLLDLGITVFAILMIFAESQMAAGFMRSYYDAKEKKTLDRLAGTILIYYLISNALVVLVVWCSRGLLATYLPDFDQRILVPILVGLLPQQITELALNVLRMERKSKIFLLLSVGQIGLACILGIIAVVPMHAGAIGVLWGLALARITFAIVSMILILCILHVRPSLKYIREVANYSIPMVPTVLGTWAQSSVGRFFIVGTLSLSMLGVYSIAMKVAGMIMLLAFSFRMVWQPYQMEQFNRKGSELIFVRVFNVYFFVMFGFLVFVTTSSPLLLRVLAPREYWVAMPYISILSVSFLWDSSKYILGSGNNWERKTYYNSYGAVVATLLNLGLLFWGTAKFGISLVAVAFLLSAMVKSVIIFRISQRNHYIPYSKTVIITGMLTSIGYAFLPYLLLTYFNLPNFYCMTIYFVVGVGAWLLLWHYILGDDEKAWMLSLRAN